MVIWDHQLAMACLLDVYWEIELSMPPGLLEWTKEHRPELIEGIIEAQKLIGQALEANDPRVFLRATDELRRAWAALIDA
ncbi:MAG TPA: hypothetical protein VGP44_05260 [Gemmatimonadales bacterium]|nr:hypothetical protein [Gemmatimonadales bacterium]